MPVGVTWLIEGHVVYGEFVGEITLDELAAFDEQTVAMLDSSSAPMVHGIHDMSAVTQYPPLSKIPKYASASRPNSSWTVMAGMPNKFLMFLASVSSQIMKLRFQFTKSVPEAVDFLRELDPSVPVVSDEMIRAARQRTQAAIGQHAEWVP